MPTAFETETHHYALEWLEQELEYKGHKIAPFTFLRPLWEIAGPPPVAELCAMLIEERHNSVSLAYKTHAIHELHVILRQQQSIGVAFADNYAYWILNNLRITWPAYAIRNKMIQEVDYAVQICLSGIFETGGWVQRDAAGGYVVRINASTGGRTLYHIPYNHPMAAWLETLTTYDKFARQLTACIIRAVATQYRDVAIAMRVEDTLFPSILEPRAQQLCNTLNLAWRYKHGDELTNAEEYNTNQKSWLKSNSKAVSRLHPRDELLIRQALDQCLLVEANAETVTESPAFSNMD